MSVSLVKVLAESVPGSRKGAISDFDMFSSLAHHAAAQTKILPEKEGARGAAANEARAHQIWPEMSTCRGETAREIWRRPVPSFRFQRYRLAGSLGAARV